MCDLYTHFHSLLQTHHRKETRCILGFSGGVDSRVVLELLNRYRTETQLEFLAVYVHHGLSANADQWQQQCQKWCEEKQIPFVAERVQLETGSGISLEASARDARYAALAKHVGEGDILLTGQHADDQIETFLLALKRGSGPKGLSAMAQHAPFAEGTLLRPLLQVSRKEIERYAFSHQLQWVEDESNADIRFDRNYLRHQVVPILSQRWPSIYQSVQRSAQLCAEQELLLDQLLESKLAQAIHIDGSLNIADLASESELLRNRLIRMWFANQQQVMPSRDHLHRLWYQVALSQQDANPQLNLRGVQVRRFCQRLYLVKEHSDISHWQHSLTLGDALVLPEQLGTLTVAENQSGTIALTNEQLHQLYVVFNPEGLKAHPSDRGHSRKLKKLFQELGVPSWLRRRTPILMCGDCVVAVADLFVDKAFIGQGCELIWDKQL